MMKKVANHLTLITKLYESLLENSLIAGYHHAYGVINILKM
jgi:hypothetical protein